MSTRKAVEEFSKLFAEHEGDIPFATFHGGLDCNEKESFFTSWQLEGNPSFMVATSAFSLGEWDARTCVALINILML